MRRQSPSQAQRQLGLSRGPRAQRGWPGDLQAHRGYPGSRASVQAGTQATEAREVSGGGERLDKAGSGMRRWLSSPALSTLGVPGSGGGGLRVPGADGPVLLL